MYGTVEMGKLHLSRVDDLRFQMRVDSDRNEVADDSTPVGFTIGSNRIFEVSRDLGGHQRVWIPILFPIRSMIETAGRGEAPWRSVEWMQVFISERNYANGTHLTFDVAEVNLLRVKSPVIVQIEVPRVVMLPRSVLPVRLEVMGTRSVRRGTHTIEATLVDERGQTHAKTVQDLASGTFLVLDTSRLRPGTYTLKASIVTADGVRWSQAESRLGYLPGPLFDR